MTLREKTSGNPWPAHVPELIGAAGTVRLPLLLDAALRDVARFDLTVAFEYAGPELRPSLRHDGLARRSGDALAAYIDGAYLLDAAYTACTHGIGSGLYRLHDLAPDAFFEGEYFNSPDVHPCISLEQGSLAEEIVYIARRDSGSYLVYSLMRSHGWARFSDPEIEALRACAPVVLGLMLRQWPEADRVTPRLAREDDGTIVEEAFRSFGADRLTRREQTVVSLVLRGHSSGSAASLLGISEGTVKLHRKAIHAKLGISSQSELFALFVAHVLGQGRQLRQ